MDLESKARPVATARDLSGAALAERPEGVIELPLQVQYEIPLEQQHIYQLKSAQRRFDNAAKRIPMITRLAEEQGVTAIRSFEDLGLLLVPHSAYKSYPMRFLEEERFDRITTWLNGLTAHDLSGLDVRGCKSIDEWLDHMDANTEIRIIHSTGTSGKLSFLPRGTIEMNRMVQAWRRMFDRFGDERPRLSVPVEEAPIIFCQYRHGGMAQHRLLDFLQDQFFGGDGSMIVTTNPGRFSADVASISGRMRVAEAKGELGALQISPALLARREAFIAEQQRTPEHMDAFFERLAGFKGRPVVVTGHVPMLYNVALQGLARGYENMFAEGSAIMAGGGHKGQALPDDWRETLSRFFGPAPLSEGYAMSEIVGSSRACPKGNFHLPPWEIPFLLDHATGAQLPRTGTQTGRFACYDINAETYWGGIVTGDEVTLSWGDTDSCGCGRVGPYVHPNIRRYTESEGGDDKITCAGAPAAHDNALDFLLSSMGA